MSPHEEHSLHSVAEEVRGFYERYPYPRPIDSLEKYRQLWQDPQRRRVDYHLFWPSRPYREDYSILIAGCGTSQAAKHALRWPAAQVVGIDEAPKRGWMVVSMKNDWHRIFPFE